MSVRAGTAQVVLRPGVPRSVEATRSAFVTSDVRFRFGLDRLPTGSA